MPTTNLTSPNRHRISLNMLWNLLGIIIPIFVGVITIPILIEGMGNSRFGVLTIAWMVVGYFGLFDLGLGRALTKVIAEKIARKAEHEIPEVVWTALLTLLLLGIIGGLTIATFTPQLVNSILKIPAELQNETISAFYYLAASIPIVVLATGLRGILEGYQRFGLVNLIRLPVGVLTFLAPLIVLPHSQSIAEIVLILVVVRLVALLTFIIVYSSNYPILKQRCNIKLTHAKELLSFGGWMTVSHTVGPLLLYFGRIFILIYISAEAVAFFVTPYEMVIKLLIIPSVVISTLFPVFTTAFENNPNSISKLYKNAIIGSLTVMTPLTVIVFIFSEKGMEFWINHEYAFHGHTIVEIIVIGVLINSIGLIAQSLIQAYGRPDLTAKLHLVELVTYIPYLIILIKTLGIVGAAIAWTIRVTISTIVLVTIAHKCKNLTIDKKIKLL